jgi:hypothetical protein
MFFGSGLGEANVSSLAFSMQNGIFENKLFMPYWSLAHVTISGVDGQLWIRIAHNPYDPNAAGYLHVTYSDARPTNSPTDFAYLHVQGSGKLVGTVLTIHPSSPTDKKWWEGDLRSSSDGRRTFGIHGTGHEDDHLGGWSNEFFSGPFSLAFNGEPKVEMLDRNGQYNANITAYRIWRGIPFWGRIDHSTEHGNENTSVTGYEAATFYYLRPGDRLAETDSVSVCDAESRAKHGWMADGESEAITVESFFEGVAYHDSVSGCHRGYTGATAMTMAIGPDNAGVWLRRMFDQSDGRQMADVLVDGERVGSWYVVEANSWLRWAERDFFLPASYTRGKHAIRIEIRPRNDHAVWDAAEYRVLSLAP